MGGDYIPFDHDFPEKRKTLAIHASGGEPIGEIMLRMFRFWRLMDRQTVDGVLRGVSLETLPTICGGDVQFWTAVKDVGWIGLTEDGSVTMPDFADRLGRHGSSRQRRKWAEQKRRQRGKVHPDVQADKGGLVHAGRVDIAVDMSAGTERTVHPDVHPSVHPDVQPIQNQNQNQNQNQETDETRRVDHLDSPWTEEVKKEVLEWCRHNFRHRRQPLIPVGVTLSASDREFLLKVGFLNVSGILPGMWVESAKEAVRLRKNGQPDNVIAYFTTVLQEQAGDGKIETGKTRLGRMLANVSVPEEMLAGGGGRGAGDGGLAKDV